MLAAWSCIGSFSIVDVLGDLDAVHEWHLQPNLYASLADLILRGVQGLKGFWHCVCPSSCVIHAPGFPLFHALAEGHA